MLFSTPFFLFVFAPVFFLLYWRLPWRSAILLAGSLVFYSWSEPVFAGVVAVSAALDWWLSWRVAAGGRWAWWWMVVGVCGNLALLLYTKYAAFAVTNLNQVLGWWGTSGFAVPHVLLPLGISFIVFEKITYLVDVHRRVARPADSLWDYLNYVFLFPKLLAGPIVKYHDIAPQLGHPTHCYEDVREGVLRFIQGLGKKVLLADLLAPTADAAFALPAAKLDPGTAWLGLACFTLQIYFDFSGYSDMAIGLARMLGFRLLENFRDPYLATSFTDFWRRWHISLSSWIREYVYIPLGGGRVGTARVYLNLCLCFLLSGLWHGASWNFVIWGCLHGVMLVLDRAFWLRWQGRLPWGVNAGLTFLLVMLSWVFFRCETLSGAWTYLQALAGAPGVAPNSVFLQTDTLAALLAGFGLVLLPLLRRMGRPGAIAVATGKPGVAAPETASAPQPGWARVPALLCAVALLVLCVGRMSVSTFQPFLYFRF